MPTVFCSSIGIIHVLNYTYFINFLKKSQKEQAIIGIKAIKICRNLIF